MGSFFSPCNTFKSAWGEHVAINLHSREHEFLVFFGALHIERQKKDFHWLQSSQTHSLSNEHYPSFIDQETGSYLWSYFSKVKDNLYIFESKESYIK